MTFASRRVLRSSLSSIFAHLSLEEALIRDCRAPTLFVWRNKPTVVIGRHQNPWKECRVDHLGATSVDLCRRYSGGGAVYQDLGCTQFTFVFPDISDHSQSLIDHNYELIQTGLRRLGLQSVARSGRNDICVAGLKVSGSAFKLKDKTLLHHGTILVNSDLDALGNLLTPNARKLQSKGIDSVRKRVGNISDFDGSICHDKLADVLFQEFAEGVAVEDVSQTHDLLETDVFTSTHSHLQSWDWRFGQTPPFTHSFSTRIESVGDFDVGLVVEEGVITQVKIASDALDVRLVDEVESRLKNVKYTADNVRDSLKDHLLAEWIVSNVAA